MITGSDPSQWPRETAGASRGVRDAVQRPAERISARIGHFVCDPAARHRFPRPSLRARWRCPGKWWGAVLSCIALVLGMRLESGAEGTPQLVIDAPVHDFGVAQQGALVNHTFQLRNVGEGELRIDDVRAPCGCTAAVLSRWVVPPGGEGSVTVTFDTTHFRGPKSKTVVVSTNDPERSVVALLLTGEVLAPLIVDPPLLYLGRIRAGAGTVGEIRVLSASGEPVNIVDATVNHPGIDVAVEPLADAGMSGRLILVRIDREMLSGRFNETVRITTGDAQRQQLEVPVFGSIEGDLLVDPPQVTFGAPARGRMPQRALRIRNAGAGPIAISRIRAAGLPLEYRVDTLRAGYEYRIVLRLKQPPGGRQQQGAVHIYTTHPQESELVVPLHATL